MPLATVETVRARHLLAPLLLLLAFTALLASVLHTGRPLAATLAGCAALVACLLCTREGPAPWALALLAALAVLLLLPLARNMPPLAPVAAAVLAYAGCTLRRHRDPGGVLVLAAAALLTALPLWYGPWAERFAEHRWLVDGPLALSPLGYLASMTGSDLLRSDWFYRHATYGLLRYDYPAPLPATVAWLAVGILARGRAATPDTHLAIQEEAPR